MKLIQRTTLHFQQGNSDKVYEVDLNEVSAGRFVVNFRFGRRGAALKEGTKTSASVARAEADRVFAALVAEKTKKGYQAVSARTPAAPPTPKPVLQHDPEARKRHILARLQATPPPSRPTPVADKNSWRRPKRPKQAKGEWPLERVIWRAGELKITEAAPLLPKFLGTGDALRDYCVAWALGHCGADDPQTHNTLGALYKDPQTPDFVRRIAGEALLKVSDAGTRAEFQLNLGYALPHPLSNFANYGPPESFAAVLRKYLSENKQHGAVLEKIYVLNNDIARPALLEELRNAPLKPGFFRAVRHIFKMAEYRQDAEVFGLLAYRFEQTPHLYHDNYWNSQRIYTYIDGKYVDVLKSSLSDEDAKAAYGQRTREYLLRRTRRTLRRLGELGDAENYVRMAVGALLPYTDADAKEPRQSVFVTYRDPLTGAYNWRNPQRRVTNYDAYAPYLLLNQLLYQNSVRYAHKRDSRAWHCASGYKAGDPAPAFREEAFPELWSQCPAGLLHLLEESACRPVHEFAVRALRECPDFLAQLDAAAVIMLLHSSYDVTARFGFELARAHFARLGDTEEAFQMALAVALCADEAARLEGQRWLATVRDRFVGDLDAVVRVLMSRYADARACGAELLHRESLPDAMAQVMIGRLVSHLLALDAAQEDVARDLSQAIREVFAKPLRKLGFAVVRDLLAHPLEAAQILGGSVLLNHEMPAAEMPGALIISLIGAEFESVRRIGLELFGRLPDETLLRRGHFIAALLAHPLADVHDATRPTAQRLCVAYPLFGSDLAHGLGEYLLQTEGSEGGHNRLLATLTEDVPAWERNFTPDTARNFVMSASSPVQEAGGRLLQLRAVDWHAEFSTEELINFSEHEVLAIRAGARALAQADAQRWRVADNPTTAHAEVAMLTRALDGKWDDSRDFWFEFFRTELGGDELTPDVLTGICDSVKPAVQVFGQELLLRYFRAENGPDYMLRLSEHPSAAMQLFVTDYLENYAAGHNERLAQLSPYFVCVLSLVNRGRTAKDRVFKFLASEAAKDSEAARIVAGILARQSATCAKGDKATAIELLLKLQQKYPFLPTPLQVKAVSVYARNS